MIVTRIIISLSFCLVFSTTILIAQGETCGAAVLLPEPGMYTSDGPATGNGCYNCTPGTPGGIPAVNADWFQFIPPSDGLLTITSCDGGADTRLWLYRGNCNNLELLASNDDFCDFAPQEPYAAAVTNIRVEAGDTLLLEWDDAWDTRSFDFEVALTPISENIVLDGWEIPFTSLPIQQLGGNIPIPVNAHNLGSMQANDIRIATEIWETGGNIALDTFLTDTFSLEPGQNKGFLMGPLSGLPEGNYYLVQRLIYQGPDDRPGDNQKTSSIFTISPNEFASDDGNYDGGIGVAGPGKFYLGQFFDIYENDTIQSIRYNIAGGNPGDTLFAIIYSYNGFTGTPQDLVRMSRPYQIGPEDPEWIEIPLQVPLPVASGDKFFFGLIHQATGTALNLGVSQNIFKPGNAWFALDNPDWVPIEGLNSQGGDEYNLAFAIRPITDPEPVSIRVTVDMREETISPDGVWLEYGDATAPIANMQLTDIGNGLYTGSFEVLPFEDRYYTFFNGTPLIGGQREIVPGPCAETAYMGIQARKIEATSTDREIPKVCFGACTVCPPLPCINPSFLICDDIEYYNPGDVSPQAPHWDTWDVVSDGGIVSTRQASSGNQSVLIDGNATGFSQDVILQLDNQGSRKYLLSIDLYIPTGKSAYFGLLHDRNPESYGWDIYFDRQDQAYVYQGSEALTSFDYPNDTWFTITWEIDLENDFNSLLLNGSSVMSGQFSVATDITGNGLPNNLALHSLNFYPFDNLYEFYIDEVYFQSIQALEGDHCFGAIALDSLFGNAYAEPRVSGNFSNQGYTNDIFDPETGTACFTETDNPWQQTVWFSFTGDGETYEISALTDGNGPCTMQAPFTAGDAHFSIYEGACNDLQAVVCSENGDNTLAPSTLLETEPGQNYYLLLDGTDVYSSLPEGEFCMQVTKIEPTVEVDFAVDMQKFLADGGTLSNEGVFIGGSITDGVLLFMEDAGNGIFKSSLPVVQNQAYDYRFYNGTDNPESLAFMAPCLEPDSMEGRWLEVGEENIILDTVCFQYCVSCDSLTSTRNVFPEGTISVFPNPAGEQFTVSSGNSNIPTFGNIYLQNMLGEKLSFFKNVNLPFTIRVGNFPAGMYWIEYHTAEGKVSVPLILQ